MALSIYVHIPYCLQRCRYCDFTTFEFSQILPPEQYLTLLKKEISSRHTEVPTQTVSTIYFGGGTPSLVPSEHIVSVLQELSNVGFQFDASTEITIEINPATIDEKKLDHYLAHGVNRFSVGAQTFNDDLLKMCGRKHSSADTIHTLQLLKKRQVNYSFDLLFALPGQSSAQVEQDVIKALEFDPPHLSAYCLTVPEGHPMAKGRALEDEQIRMFEIIESRLYDAGIYKYEISNFAKPKLESRHNQSYWSDADYWGIGLSSHSYFNSQPYGLRFWNPNDFKTYQQQIANPLSQLPPQQKEHLLMHEAATDFCHMFLRTRKGLSIERLRKKFPITDLIETRLDQLQKNGLLNRTIEGYTLSSRGELLSNCVFAELTFLAQDFAAVDSFKFESILENL